MWSRRRKLSAWATMCVEAAECFKPGLSLSGYNFQMFTLEKEMGPTVGGWP